MNNDIKELIGKTLVSAVGKRDDEKVIFIDTEGTTYTFLHRQDCCENVRVEDICGDIADLIGTPLVEASVTTEEGNEFGESQTWTFYRFATVNGTVTIRWLGESNGYYSESVDLEISPRRNKSMIKLGTIAKDRITGFEGVAIGRTEWLYGCVRIGIEPQELHDGKPIEAQWFDEQRIVELGEIPVCAGASEGEGAGPGGPRNDSASRRTDPTR